MKRFNFILTLFGIFLAGTMILVISISILFLALFLFPLIVLILLIWWGRYSRKIEKRAYRASKAYTSSDKGELKSRWFPNTSNTIVPLAKLKIPTKLLSNLWLEGSFYPVVDVGSQRKGTLIGNY